MPRVAVGLPVFNGERYVGAALDGLKSQTFDDFEVLVSDNSSTDGTEELVRDLCAGDRRFRYHRQSSNVGAAANFNYVFHHTTAPYFRWQSYDDVIAPTYLERCVSALDDDRDAVLAFTQTLMIDEQGVSLGVYDAATRRGSGTASARLRALIGPGDDEASLLHLCFPVFGLMRRDALDHTSLIANMPRSDHLLLVELALAGEFAEVDEPLFHRREHAAGSVIAAERSSAGTDIERELAAWFDPARGVRFPATTTRLALGFTRAAARTPRPLDERLRCTAMATAWALRRARVIGGEVKIVLKESFASRRNRGTSTELA